MISDKSLSDRQPCADLFDLAYRLNHIKNDNETPQPHQTSSLILR